MNPALQQQPYTTTLSLLRKIDLLRLAVEFKRPSHGTVQELKDDLRKYLNTHCKTLYKNPRFRPLYPKFRRPTMPARPQAPVGPAPPIRSPSPSTSDSSDTTNESFESWNGIEVPPEHHDPPQLPVVPPQDPPIYHYPPPPPPPPPSIPGSEPEPFPFANYDDEPRKYFLPSTPSYLSVMSISLLSSISPIHARYGIFYSFTLRSILRITRLPPPPRFLSGPFHLTITAI